MKLAIMQPYFLPYVGYFQLISAVDEFVVYDNIKFTKKGWINRNRLLLNGKDAVFTVPLLKASDDLQIVQRELAAEFSREKLLAQFRGAYQKAPYFSDVFPLLRSVISFEERNLFDYIFNSIRLVCAYLEIDTHLRVSSTVPADHSLRAEERVLSICEGLAADIYINAIGGVDLYDKSRFAERGVLLQFLRSRPVQYQQFNSPFVPWLSIVDVMMFNDVAATRAIVASEFDLE